MKNADPISEKSAHVENLGGKAEQYDYSQISRKTYNTQNNRRYITLSDVDTSFINVAYDIYAESSIGGREENQDYYSAVETPYGLLLLVCDGMGGANGGAMASKLAVTTIVERIERSPNYATPAALLYDVIEHANNIVYQRSLSESQFRGMGTTIVALLLSDQKATVAHVGDSRLYHIRKRKRIFRTFDHSMVFELVRRGSLTEEEARLSAKSNVILQALGTKPVVDNIDITDNIPYVKGDRFLLCSDGVSGAVAEPKLLSLATTDKSVKQTVKKMITTINDIGVAGGNEHDNLTAIILEVKGRSALKAKRRVVNLLFYIFTTIAIIGALSLAIYVLYNSIDLKTILKYK